MSSQRSLVMKLAAQTLQHLLKALGVVPRWSFQKVLFVLSKLWRLFSSIRSKRTLGPNPAELREQPLHPDTRNSLICTNSLPISGIAEKHSLATPSPITAPDLCYRTGSSELGSTHAFLDAASSITQVSRVPTPLPNSVAPLNHDSSSIQTAQTSSDKEDNIVAVTPREYERYSRAKL